jgi:simple sugar transport system ATP-binding protein
MRDEYLVEMRGITKRFPGVVANKQVSLTVKPGEIHALLGENGAGKTTLMNILYGLHRPDEGEIFIRSQAETLPDPRTAIRHGIGMVHQHFMLVPVLTVTENIILGLPPGKGPILDFEGARRRIRELSTRSGLVVDPEAKVWQLPVGVQQRVEILKFLYRGTSLLILDEPTAVLTPSEVDRLFTVIRQLRADGLTLIFISHKLKEVMAISDRVTVMRDGKNVRTVNTEDTSKEELARLMVGRQVLFRIEREPPNPGQEVLRISNLSVLDDRNLRAVDGLSLSLREGEVLGIAGVSGNGQEELAEALCGLRRTDGGEIIVAGRNIADCDPRSIMECGVSQIPADRQRMTVPDFSIAENAVLPLFRQRPFSAYSILDWEAVRGLGERLIEGYDIRVPSATVAAGALSGGNLQKLILARQMCLDPRLLVAVQPTRGLDVGAIEFVHHKLLEERDQGRAILLISTDLDEIMQLSDRVAVMYEGQIVDTLDRDQATIEAIALLMAGDKKTAGAD